jgi:hypothetical protein
MDKPGVEATATPAPRGPVYAWWLVLALVGLDYFSTLAYLPSIAVQADRSQAPLAALGVVLITLVAALPVYLYVVGRSPHGQGALGLLENLVYGWGGKVFLLVLLGFVATDFVVTRTVSVADAAKHITHNPLWKDYVEGLAANKEEIRGKFPAFLQGGFFDFWNEQVVLTVVLAVLTFGFYAFVVRGFRRPFMVLAVLVVGLYLVLTGIVVGSGLAYLAHHPERLEKWLSVLNPVVTQVPPGIPVEDVVETEGAVAAAESTFSVVAALSLYALLIFPQMALGLSGFELSMTSAPLVRGRPGDDPARPRRRIRGTRLLMTTAAVVMSVFLLGSVLAVAQLVPQKSLKGTAVEEQEWNGPAMHRALAYLAHGGEIDVSYAEQGPEGQHPAPVPASDVSPLFGPAFGTLYDVSTVLILCLAGASVTIGLRDVVPHYLTKFGMQPHWAEKVGVTLHLFNVVILVVVIAFHASVSAQQWAYAASVLVLLTGASLAALLEVRRRWRRSLWMPLLVLPFLLVCFLFLAMVGLTLLNSRSGLYIPLILVAVLLATAFVSRWLRSTELRFRGFDFADEASQARWEEIRGMEFQVLVPHRAGGPTLAEQDREVRARHRLGPDVPILFVEPELGDPSEFFQAPLVRIETRDGREVIRISRCASVSHVIAAAGLQMRHVGRPPEIHFAWSEESPVAANVGFLFFGEGNVPWMVHALLRKAEPDPERRPRVVIG